MLENIYYQALAKMSNRCIKRIFLQRLSHQIPAIGERYTLYLMRCSPLCCLQSLELTGISIMSRPQPRNSVRKYGQPRFLGRPIETRSLGFNDSAKITSTCVRLSFLHRHLVIEQDANFRFTFLQWSDCVFNYLHQRILSRLRRSNNFLSGLTLIVVRNVLHRQPPQTFPNRDSPSRWCPVFSLSILVSQGFYIVAESTIIFVSSPSRAWFSHRVLLLVHRCYEVGL